MLFNKDRYKELILKLKQGYAEQLRRKDREISQLKREKELLMKTALKQSENTTKWMEYAKKLEEKASEEKK